MKSLFYDFFKSYNVAGSMEEYMSHKFCNEIRVEIKDNKKQIDLDTDLATEDSITIISRKLRTSNHEKIVGKDIIDRAKYIIDCKDVEENAIYAGEVVDFKRMESKKTGNSYYVFKIDDSTGQLICKAFTKYKGEGEYDKIAIGDQIIVKGKVDIDTYLHDSVLMCRDVSRCCIDKTSVILKEELKTAPLKYTSVFPEQYEDFVQTDLFSENDNIIPEFLLSKTFVVFDFETTGLDIGSEVIELGAVKVENGVITQGFSTFVNPHMSIPENITELTNITDQDVQNAPSMDEVVADFYKFAENSVLVAHNISFDKMFLDKYAKLNRYLFSNKTMDTLDMAKKVLYAKIINWARFVNILELICKGHIELLMIVLQLQNFLSNLLKSASIDKKI